MDSSSPTHEEPAGEEAAAAAPESLFNSGKSAARRMGRERLLRYVHDVIRKQRTPLQEVIREHALPFLPAQSLLRLRSVSTSWRRHISSPFFAHTQSLSHRSPSGLLPVSQPYPPASYLPFDPASGAVRDPSFSFLPVPAVWVNASARGLVCCSTVDSRFHRTSYYVCNPATAQWTAVPGSSLFGHRGVALLFRPSPLTFHAEFDLVGVVESNWRVGFEVFSSRTGRWRMSDEVLAADRALCRGPAVTAGGRAYWGTGNGAVLSYDLAADRSQVVELPEDVATRGTPWRLAEVDERLCCCSVRRTASESSAAVDVYALEEGGTWKKTRTLEVGGSEVEPLMSESGDHEVLIWVDGGVVALSLASGRGRLLGGQPAPRGGKDWLPYVSSLVHVDGEIKGLGKIPTARTKWRRCRRPRRPRGRVHLGKMKFLRNVYY